MSVLTDSRGVRRPSWVVVRALIEEARRRARRRRMIVLLVAAVAVAALLLLARDNALLGSATAANGAVIPLKWVETQTFANDAGVVRLYVRRLTFTGTTWKVSVGLTNLSKRRIELKRTQRIFQDSGRPD